VQSSAHRGAYLLVALLLFLLAWGGVAQAAEFTVDSIGDQPDQTVGSEGCKTAGGACTLRAAIEESNASVGQADTIRFSFSRFAGRIGDTIHLNSSLPTITDQVNIGGFPPVPCETDYRGVEGPCVGIEGPAGGTIFRVTAHGVVLLGLAMSGARTAVEGIGSSGLQVSNDWIGLKPDGGAGPVETGVHVDQATEGAIIGGGGSDVRDIFAHTGVGLDVEGADGVEVTGDGFGVMPDGATPASNGTDIRVGDARTGEDRVARDGN